MVDQPLAVYAIPFNEWLMSDSEDLGSFWRDLTHEIHAEFMQIPEMRHEPKFIGSQ